MKLSFLLTLFFTHLHKVHCVHSKNFLSNASHTEPSLNDQIRRVSALEKGINVAFFAYSLYNINTLPVLAIQVGLHFLFTKFSMFTQQLTHGLEKANKRYPYIQKTAVEIARASDVSENIQVYIRKDKSVNAYTNSVLPSHPIIVLYQGLIDEVPYKQLCGVISHEIGHIKNLDMFRAHKVLILADIIFKMLSRFYEFRADMHEALIIGSDQAIAFMKSQEAAETRIELSLKRESTIAYSIYKWLKGISGAFRTHPTYQERITMFEDIKKSNIKPKYKLKWSLRFSAFLKFLFPF